jgi:hypothetical protein
MLISHCLRGTDLKVCDERVCCLLVLDSVASTPQWRDMGDEGGTCSNEAHEGRTCGR